MLSTPRINPSALGVAGSVPKLCGGEPFDFTRYHRPKCCYQDDKGLHVGNICRAACAKGGAVDVGVILHNVIV
jgi:hypothetical protein